MCADTNPISRLPILVTDGSDDRNHQPERRSAVNGRLLIRDPNMRPVGISPMPCYNATITESVALLTGLASRATAGFEHYVEDLPLKTTP